MPVSSEDGWGGLVLTFSCLNADNRGGPQLSVEHSSDLGITDDWVGALVPDVAGVSGVLFNAILGDPLNTVTATIQSTEAVAGKVFGRLSATE